MVTQSRVSRSLARLFIVVVPLGCLERLFRHANLNYLRKKGHMFVLMMELKFEVGLNFG